MSRDVITVGSTMRIPLLYRGKYSQWSERFMNYLEEQTDGEAMINSIRNGEHPLPVVAQVSLAGTAPNAPPTLKDPKFWTAKEKKTRKIDQRHMRATEYGKQDKKAAILYEYETFKATEGEQLLDTYLRYLQVINDLKKCGYKKDNCELNYKFLNNLQLEWKQYGTLMRQTKYLMDINIDALYNILKQNQGDVDDAMEYKKKAVVVTSDPLALVAEKTKVSKRKEKVVVQSESEGSDDEDISNLKKITALLAKAFNRKKYYAKLTNNNLRTSLASSSANKKPDYVKSEEKKEDKKADEKKRDMSKVKCYNCKKEGHFAKDCKKAKVKNYDYYKTKMLLAKKNSNEQVLLVEDQAWMESSSDSDQENNPNMVFMAKIEKVLSDSEESSSTAEETIAEVSYYTSDSESESEYETSEYYDNSTNYGLFVDNDDDQEIYHDAIEFASENFNENHIVSQTDHDQPEVDHNDSEEKDHLVDKLIKKFNQKIAKCQKHFKKIDSSFQQTSLLKPYVPTVILENIIIDLEDEVSSKNAISESENQSENNCQEVEKGCDSLENSKVIAPGMFKINVSQSVSPISTYKTSCASNNVGNKTKRKRRKRTSSKQNDKQVNNDVLRANRDFVYFSDLDTLSSVRRPKHSGVFWKKKGSSNTSKVDLSSVSHSKLNKDVKRYSRKDLLSCNNSHHVDTRSAYACNDTINVSCNSRLYASCDVNDLFVFDDVSIRKSQVSKMPFRKKPRDSLNVYSRSNSNTSLSRTVFRWLPKMQPLAEPIAKWIPKIVQICLWIIDSGCSKHMTGNRAFLTNFVEKFLGTVRFGNNDFAVIAGYGDVVIGSMTIKKVYYVEGLGHNLFSVGQFCDKGLEVAFRKSTCFVQNEDGVDLLTGDRSSNLYTIALNEIASNSSAYLLAKASSSQSWLWHQRLSHLNFTTIKNLMKNNLVRGLPKMKFEKDHLCSGCEQGKIHRKHHKSKMDIASNKPLYLLHMDLCVESINGKRYVLVVVDDYSWYTWVFFLHSKDEASEIIISFIKKTQVNHQLQVQRVRTDNGTEFKNKTLAKCYLLNDYDDVGKLKAKWDIGVFVGYSKESAAFKVYNKRKSSNPSVSQVSKISKKDLEDLFYNFYDEYFDSSKITKSQTTNVETSNNEIPSHEGEVFHEVSESFQEESSSSSLNDDVQQSSEEVMVSPTNTQLISNNVVPSVNEASSSHNVFDKRLEDAYFDTSTSFHDPSNVHTFYQPYPHEKKLLDIRKRLGHPVYFTVYYSS
ncbi:integrase, catalytic region, zinc finger, CCHC-type containing protein [Tanacetum coccineum]